MNIEEKMDVSKSIVVLSNQIDNSLQLTNDDSIESIPLKFRILQHRSLNLIFRSIEFSFI